MNMTKIAAFLSLGLLAAACASTPARPGAGPKVQLLRVQGSPTGTDLTGYQPAAVISSVGPMDAAPHLKQMPHGYEGRVLLDVEVLSDGSVGSVRVVKGIDEIFGTASVRAVKQWRFRPTLSPSGRPVTSWVRLHVGFKMR